MVPDSSVYSFLHRAATQPRVPPCRAVTVSGSLHKRCGVIPTFFSQSFPGCSVYSPLHTFGMLHQKLDRILNDFIYLVDPVGIPAARHQRGK